MVGITEQSYKRLVYVSFLEVTVFKTSTSCVKSHYHPHHPFPLFTLPAPPKFPFPSPLTVVSSHPQLHGGYVLPFPPLLALQPLSAGVPLLLSLAAASACVAAAPPQDNVAALLLSCVHKKSRYYLEHLTSGWKFRCYEAKKEESEKAGSHRELNPGHLLFAPVLCH